jgi:hypothetical protein
VIIEAQRLIFNPRSQSVHSSFRTTEKLGGMFVLNEQKLQSCHVSQAPDIPAPAA